MPRPPEPETIDVEPASESPIRPEDDYRVGARISVADAGRTRAAGVAAGSVIVMGLVLATLGSLFPAAPEDFDLPTTTPAVATALPVIAILDEPIPSRHIPVYSGGLRWLNPADASISGDPYKSPRNGIFVDAEGQAICLCIELPWSRDGHFARVTIRRYDGAGNETARSTIRELLSESSRVFGEAVSFDATISTDGRTMWIARAVRAAEAWEVGIDRVDLATLTMTSSLELPPIPVPAEEGEHLGPTDAGWITNARSGVRPTVRATPSGDLVSVGISLFVNRDLGPELPRYQVGRYVVPGDLVAPDGARLVVRGHDAVLDACDASRAAWATDAHYVTLCVNADETSIQPFVRVETRDGVADEIAVGPPVGRQDSSWLLNTTTGTLVRWSSQAHVLTSLKVATGEATTLEIERALVGAGTVDAWPEDGAGPVTWASFAGSEASQPAARIVGSGDGSVMYALGYRSVPDPLRNDRIASTGIWVFDTARTALVARWPAEALYNEIGITPGHEQLMTIAEPDVDENGAPADWSTSIRFHDPYLGIVTELLGDMQESSGFVPIMLPANVPSPLQGG